MPHSPRITNQEYLSKYQSDESSAFKGKAKALYLPNNETELQKIIKKANLIKELVTISGAGTGITGSRVATYGGVIVSTEKIKKPQSPISPKYKIIEDNGYQIYINKKSKEAIAPASIPLATLNNILSKANLFYPPDPTESTASLGGTVATNASGSRSFYFGSTRKWVKGIRAILPTGQLLQINRNELLAKNYSLHLPFIKKTIKIPPYKNYPMPKTKNAAGLYLKKNMDLVDLFIGSEGILGCFIDIKIKLHPMVPHTFTIMAFFLTWKTL